MINETWQPLLFFDNPTDLSNFPVNGQGLGQGTEAQVRKMRGVTSGGGFTGGVARYYLADAISNAPDNFYVCQTPDNPGLQWVHAALMEQSNLGVLTTEIDFTVPQTLVVVPPLTDFRWNFCQSPQWIVTAKDGTVTQGPTAQMGTDAGISNILPSTIQTITGLSVNGNQNINPLPTTANNLDMSVTGWRLQITVGAILGTATTFKGRLRMLWQLARY